MVGGAHQLSFSLSPRTPFGDRWGGARTFCDDANPTSPKTEITAMIVALLWCLQVGNQHPHFLVPFNALFGYDCMLAGHTAAGQWKIHAHEMLQTHGRGLVLWIEQRFQVNLQWQHIKSHTGHPWNEAADALSWAAVHEWINAPAIHDVIEVLNIGDGSNSSWLWMWEASMQGRQGLPHIDGTNFKVNISQPHQCQPDETHSFQTRQHHESPQQARTDTEVNIRFATANVLTLYAGDKARGNYVSARQEALMKQMHGEGLNFIGIQESRSGLDGYATSEHYHVLSSAATARGVGGVQLWISKQFKFPHRDLSLTCQDLKILRSSAQRMVVRVEARWLRIIIVVCHAPSSSTYDTADSYWASTSNSIPERYRNWPTVYLCDANARIGSTASQSVGTWGAEIESESGTAFHHWLRMNQLCIPQTFAQHHSGSHHTWRHAGGALARIDYIVIDECVWTPQIHTWISDNIDITTKRDDHFCVCAKIPWKIWDCTSVNKEWKKQSLDTKDPAATEEKALDVEWSCNVHNHAARLQQWLQAQQGPQKAKGARKAHLRAETWKMIQSKRHHWKRIRQIRNSLRCGWLRAVFAAWKSGGKTSEAASAWHPWMKLGDVSVAWHLHQYRQITNPQVRADDAHYYENLVEGQVAALADEGMPGLWKKIRCVLPRQRAKHKSNLRCTGPDPVEVQQHFCNLEAGEKVDYKELLRRCKDTQAMRCYEAPLTMKLNQIPTRTQMEQLILKQKSQKAPGLDGTISETIKHAARGDSLPLYQLYFKAWTTGSEPLQFKGGLIHCIAKKSGSKEAHKMRGIMLLETAGKIFHGLARSQLLNWSLPRRMMCQFGGYPAQQTLYATQLIGAITRVYGQHGMSSGVLFIDVKAAFHSMLREHTFGGHSDLTDVLLHQLTKEGMCARDLNATIHAASSAFCQTAPPGLVQMMQDMHSHTWFTLSQHDEVYQTHRGSRPGSPLADLAYNSMMQAVLERLQDRLQEIPQLQTAKATIGLDCPPLAWVDDVAIPFVAQSVTELDSTALMIMDITAKVFQEFGLSLNTESGKTEAVIQYRGQGSGPKIEATFVENFGNLVSDTSGTRLRIVTDYNYLGTTFAQTAQVGHEIATRIGKAKFAFRQMRKAIFCNRRLPVSTRITLLNSLVVSIVLHGAGNWPLLSTAQFNKLAHVVTGWHASQHCRNWFLV